MYVVACHVGLPTQHADTLFLENNRMSIWASQVGLVQRRSLPTSYTGYITWNGNWSVHKSFDVI